MKQKVVLLLLLVAIVSMGTAIFALDDQGNVNDPNVNDRANACYEDGTMAGKCDTDWAWTCGYYLIRFESGLISRDQVAGECESLLPDLPATSDSSSDKKDKKDGSSGDSGKCAGPIYGFAYVKFGSSNFLSAPVTVYDDADCTSTYTPINLSLVYSSSGLSDAQDICEAKDPGTDANFIANNVYRCDPT